MKNFFKIFIIAILSCLFLIPSVNYVKANEDDTIYLGGIPAGFSIYSRGATVIGLSDVVTENGLVSPSKDAGIKAGDIILSIDGNEVNNILDIENNLKNDNVKIISIKRGDDILLLNIKPQKDLVGNIKLGVFIRAEIDGIGTITFIKNDKIVSLGHPILDNENKLIEITSGNLYNCVINGCVKGEKGKPGELKGILIRDKQIGSIYKNTTSGVYASMQNIDYNKLTKIEVGDAKIGDAFIYSTVNGREPKKYSIKIVKDDNSFSEDKNYFIKINDKELLETTGGIVQGMSGSPIVQEGKLVGAVTHVFINDPTRGYGISITNMLSKL